MDDLHDLECLLRSRIPLIIIESRDERRVARLFTQLAITLAKPVMGWSATNGLQRLDYDSVPQRHASAPEQALGQIKATNTPGIYLLMDFHPYLDDAYNIRLLKEIALDYDEFGHTLAREQNSALNTAHIAAEIEQTQPLSRVMAEPLARLRHWARDRTVPAN